MLRYGLDYVAQEADYYEKQYANRLRTNALKTLSNLGYDVEIKPMPTLEESVC